MADFYYIRLTTTNKMNEIANVASPGFTDLLANNNCTSQTAQVESCSSFGQKC